MTNSQFDLLTELIKVIIKDETDRHNFYYQEIADLRKQLVTETDKIQIDTSPYDS